MTERYAVLAPQGLGDSLEATPLLQALRDARPAAHVDVWVLRPAARDLFAGLPELVDRVVYLPYWERGAGAFAAALLRERTRSRYDALFTAYPAARREYHAVAALIRAKARYAHDYGGSRLASLQWVYTRTVAPAAKHNVLRNLDLLDLAGIAHGVPDRYSVPCAWRSAERRDARAIALHVGTIAHDGLESRRWPLERFIALAQRLRDEGFRILAISGPAEREETQRLAQAVPQAEIVEGPLDAVARRIASAGLVVANDNGIAHVAAGVGTPVVSLFGPTPLEHAPYGPASYPLRPSACPPCFDVRLLNTNCALGIDYACLKRDLPVDVVHRAVLERAAPAGDAQAAQAPA